MVEVDVDDTQATALAIALNRSGELAEWDMATLGRLLDSLRTEDAIEGLGFEDAEIDEILGDLLAAEPADVDDPGPGEPPEEPVTQPGDLWLLGGHRLLCGDSTAPESFQRLMAGETASLLATDAPYLVDYDAGSHPPSESNRPEVRNKGWDAYVDPPTSVSFFRDYLVAALVHCRENVAVYQWHAHKRQALVEEAWIEAGLLVHQQLIWTKAHAVLTRSHFMWGHEPCFYGWPKGSMPAKDRRPPPNASTVWPIDQTGEPKGIHPTIKPVEIFERPISWHTKPNEVCLEPFSGSGTQLIAAEKLHRRCFALELSPAFVDVAVRRWEEATGKEATLDGDGRTFAEIATERSA